MRLDCHAIRSAALEFGSLRIEDAIKAEQDIETFLYEEMIEIDSFRVEQSSQFHRQIVVICSVEGGGSFARVCYLEKAH